MSHNFRVPLRVQQDGVSTNSSASSHATELQPRPLTTNKRNLKDAVVQYQSNVAKQAFKPWRQAHIPPQGGVKTTPSSNDFNSSAKHPLAPIFKPFSSTTPKSTPSHRHSNQPKPKAVRGSTAPSSQSRRPTKTVSNYLPPARHNVAATSAPHDPYSQNLDRTIVNGGRNVSTVAVPDTQRKTNRNQTVGLSVRDSIPDKFQSMFSFSNFNKVGFFALYLN